MALGAGESTDGVAPLQALTSVKRADHRFEATDQASAVVDAQYRSAGDQPGEMHYPVRRCMDGSLNSAVRHQIDTTMPGGPWRWADSEAAHHLWWWGQGPAPMANGCLP
jgi:hypothetical protein